MSIELGSKVRDRITGYIGIVVARSEWLYGCVRITVQQEGLDKDNKISHEVFDEAGLDTLMEAEKMIPVEERKTGGDQAPPSRRMDITR